jgi:hypothetical protein
MNEFDGNIPQYAPNYEEITKMMRINADILKKEISLHVDQEIIRIKKEFYKIEYPDGNWIKVTETNDE